MPLPYLACIVDSVAVCLRRSRHEGELVGGYDEPYEVEGISREYPSGILFSSLQLMVLIEFLMFILVGIKLMTRTCFRMQISPVIALLA